MAKARKARPMRYDGADIAGCDHFHNEGCDLGVCELCKRGSTPVVQAVIPVEIEPPGVNVTP